MNEEKSKIFSKNTFKGMVVALIATAFLLVLAHLTASNINRDSISLANQTNESFFSQDFNFKIAGAIDKKDLSLCEDFQNETQRIGCLMKSAPESWMAYQDENLCNDVSVEVFSSPMRFLGETYIHDYQTVCLTFLSLGANKNLCHKASNEASQKSCSDIVSHRITSLESN